MEKQPIENHELGIFQRTWIGLQGQTRIATFKSAHNSLSFVSRGL